MNDQHNMRLTARRIFFRELALPVSIGIHDFEREAPQTIHINITIELADVPLPTADDIAEVLDYDFVHDGIRRLTAGRHFNLQETLCHEILGLFAGRTGIRHVRLSTAKPDVYADVAAVGYEVECSFD